MIDHRADCQLYTVPTYGLCTCDFDQRMDAGDMRPLTTSIPTDTGTIQERLRATEPYFANRQMPFNAKNMREAADRIDALEKALTFYATGCGAATDIESAACGDIDLARATERFCEDCGDVARAALHPSDNEVKK